MGGSNCLRGHEKGVIEMSTFVHLRGEGVKNDQNLVHVDVEFPLSRIDRTHAKGAIYLLKYGVPNQHYLETFLSTLNT